MFSFASTSGWKNILAAEITGEFTSKHVYLYHYEQLRKDVLSVSDLNPAAENPNDRNALAQAATGSGLLRSTGQ